MIISKNLRRSFCGLLCAAQLFGVSAVPTSAAEGSADFLLEVNGESAATVGVDDTATVTLTIQRDSDYDFYSMQDYIKFDTEYFTLDETSIKVKTYVNDGIETDLMNYSPIKNGDEYDRVFVNRASLTPMAFSASETVITFDLTPKKTGTTEVTHYRTEMTDADNSAYTVNELNATVTIVSGSVATEAPTEEPTAEPTEAPTEEPTATPAASPTATPRRSSGGGGGGGYRTSASPSPSPTAAPEATAAASAAPDSTTAPGTSSTQAPASGFTDVSDDEWYADAVKYVFDEGIMDGIDDTTFGPRMPVTRAMFVTIIHRMEGSPTPTTVSTFEDVERGAWYTDAVDWAAENNIVYGYSDEEYAPNQIILREQMAAILYRYYGFKGISTDVENSTGYTEFTDSAAISEYAVSAVNWAAEIGIMTGDTEGTFRPTDSTTRAEAAQVIMNIRTKQFKEE